MDRGVDQRVRFQGPARQRQLHARGATILCARIVRWLRCREQIRAAPASVSWKGRRTKAFQVFCRRVFRAVDDSQIFVTTAFNGWLNQPVTILGDEIQRLHNHAFAAASGHFLPPVDAFGFTLRSGHVNDTERGGDDDAARQTRQSLHVPVVWLVHMDLSFRGQQMKRRELQVGHEIDGPAAASDDQVSLFVFQIGQLAEKIALRQQGFKSFMFHPLTFQRL